jgi:hypothetical protein
LPEVSQEPAGRVVHLKVEFFDLAAVAVLHIPGLYPFDFPFDLLILPVEFLELLSRIVGALVGNVFEEGINA